MSKYFGAGFSLNLDVWLFQSNPCQIHFKIVMYFAEYQSTSLHTAVIAHAFYNRAPKIYPEGAFSVCPGNDNTPQVFEEILTTNEYSKDGAISLSMPFCTDEYLYLLKRGNVVEKQSVGKYTVQEMLTL